MTDGDLNFDVQSSWVEVWYVDILYIVCLWQNGQKYIYCVCFQYEQGKKRKKPNYSSVDLSEVEWEDKEDMVCIWFFSLWPCYSE